MKNRINHNTKKIPLTLTLFIMGGLLIMSALSSCNKKDAEPVPVIERVYVLDTVARHKDSSVVGAEPLTLLVIHGQNLGGTKNVYFNGYEASFNANYNTETDLIIRLPLETPTDLTVSNKIRLVTSHGETSYDFKVIAKPTIYSYDIINFGTGRDEITFKGKNFEDIISVKAMAARDKPTDPIKDSVMCIVVSKTVDKLVVRVPSTTMSRVTFNFTNSSGTTRLADQFVNADVAILLFTEDFGNISSPDGTGKWEGGTWANPVTINSDQAFGGKKSISIALNAGGWSWFGLQSWWPRYYYSTDYKYFTFAIKGGANDMSLWISSSATKNGGNGSFPDKNKIDVKANVWNYYILPISDMDFLYSDSIIQQFGFRPKGPDKADLIYLDDLMLVK
jgi:hypothetical protein